MLQVVSPWELPPRNLPRRRALASFDWSSENPLELNVEGEGQAVSSGGASESDERSSQ